MNLRRGGATELNMLSFTVGFVLFPDLTHTRFKDAELPYQRIVLVQSTVLALVKRARPT